MTETFATILRQALDERGITASTLARRMWGSEEYGAGARNRQLISRYLSGHARPKLDTIERIAAALGIPVAAFIPGLGDDRIISVEASFEGDKIHLKIDRSVDSAIAIKILGILSAA